jgi:hypothetical protein
VIKVVMALRRRDDVVPEEFHRYWREVSFASAIDAERLAVEHAQRRKLQPAA